MHGDVSFASLIAEDNGFNEEDKPTPGLTLRIPNLVNTNAHNWEGIYAPYNPNAIIGSLYPNMPMPVRKTTTTMQPVVKKHKKFWHTLIEALVGAAVMTVAPELFAGAFSGVLSSLLGEVLGFAVAGAASSMVQQELAMGFGDQSKISWNNIGQSALLAAGTAGVAKGLKVNLVHSSQYKDLANAALKNIELTLTTQGLSFATGQQRHFDWRSFVANIGTSLANAGIAQNHLSVPLFNDTLATASSTLTSIGIDRLLGKELDAETIAATTLGTFIGNQLAAVAKQRYREFQAQKEAYTNRWISQIPELKESLAQSEHQFLHAIKPQHNPIGHVEGTKAFHERSQKTAHNTHAQHTNPPPTPVHEAHLKTKHAKEDLALQKASNWAKRNAHTPSQTKVSTHGFWGKAERTKSLRLAVHNKTKAVSSEKINASSKSDESCWRDIDSVSETKLLAAIAYGEAHQTDVYKEMAGIASAVVRRRDLDVKHPKSVAELVKLRTTYAYVVYNKNERFINLMCGDAKNFKKAYNAASNALNYGVDYSNGGCFWDGYDLKTQGVKHPKYRDGFRYSDSSHNIFAAPAPAFTKREGSGHNEKYYSVVYVSTAAHGKTVFWKADEQYLKAEGALQCN